MKPSPSPPPAPRRRSVRVLMSAVTAFTLSSCATSSPPVANGPTGVDGIAPLPRPSNPAPETDWPTYGLNLSETRFSPLDQIDSDNVSRLGVAWSWEIPRTGARLEATPLIADGVMYATGPMSFVYALDARTGEEIWQWDPAIPDEAAGGPSLALESVWRPE